MEFRARKVGQVPISWENRVVLSGQHLVAADFSGRSLEQFSAEGCRFERCRFDNAVIQDASFGSGRRASEYIDCNFDGAKMRIGPGGYARFVNCSFEVVAIEHWFCFAVELVGCTFSGRLQKVIFNGSVPPEDQGAAGRTVNQFEGNDFSQARLVDVGFRTGIDLTKQRLPDGDEYVYLSDAAAALKRARAFYDSWDDLDLKEQARGLLPVMEATVAAGQAQLLMRPKNYPLALRPGIRTLLEAAAQA